MFWLLRARVSLVLACIAIAGCADNKLACSDEAPTDLVKSIVVDSAVDFIKQQSPDFASNADAVAAVRKQLESTPMVLADTMTTAKDKDTGRISCQASLQVSAPTIADTSWAEQQVATLREIAHTNDVDHDGAKFSHDVSYTAQRTDDNKKVYVQLKEARPIVEVIASKAMIEYMNSIKKPEAPAAPQVATSVRPEVTSEEEIEGSISIDMDRVADLGASELVVAVADDADAVAVVSTARSAFVPGVGGIVKVKCDGLTTVGELPDRYLAMKNELPPSNRVHFDCRAL